MKILIIRFSSIGDIVLTSPVIRCLKKQIPNAEIHYLTKHNYRDIVEYNPHLDKKHYLTDDLGAVISDLKKEKFDFIADLHNNLRTWIIKSNLLRRSNTFNKLNFEKWIYVNLKWNILPDIHLVDRYLEPVRGLGVRNDNKGLDYFLGPDDTVPLESLPLSHLHGYVSIVIGAKHNTKKLPSAKLKSLCRHLSYPIVLLGGPEDREAGQSLQREDPIKIFNACGSFSLNQSASLIRQSRLVITHDTGLMHIAAAFRKKIISVWGSTVPLFGMYPYFGSANGENKKYSGIVEVKKLWCRPCSKLGYSRCPLGHFKCMNLIDEEQVAALVKKL